MVRIVRVVDANTESSALQNDCAVSLVSAPSPARVAPNSCLKCVHAVEACASTHVAADSGWDASTTETPTSDAAQILGNVSVDADAPGHAMPTPTPDLDVDQVGVHACPLSPVSVSRANSREGV